MKPRGAKRVTSLILIPLSLLLLFLLLEGSTKIWLRRFASDEQLTKYGTFEQNRKMRNALQQHLMFAYQPHRYIGYVPTPNYRQGKNYHNSLGYRGEDFSFEKLEGEFRVVCLGGSTTYTIGAEDPAQAYPAQLQNVLHEMGYSNVRVINSGAPGWTLYESMINFQLRILDLSPDLIILYHGINDAAARLVYPYEAYRGDNSGHRLDARDQPTLPVYATSDFLRTVLIATGRIPSPMSLQFTLGKDAETSLWLNYWDQFARGVYPSGIFVEHPLDDLFRNNTPKYFVLNSQNLLLTALSNRVAAVVLTFKITSEFEDDMNNAPAIRNAVDEQNAILMRMAPKYGAAVFDFASEFPNDRIYYVNSDHLNVKGARLKAEHIAKFLEESKLLPGQISQRPPISIPVQ